MNGWEGKHLQNQATLVLETRLLSFVKLLQFNQNGGALSNGIALAYPDYPIRQAEISAFKTQPLPILFQSHPMGVCWAILF